MRERNRIKQERMSRLANIAPTRQEEVAPLAPDFGPGARSEPIPPTPNAVELQARLGHRFGDIAITPPRQQPTSDQAIQRRADSEGEMPPTAQFGESLAARMRAAGGGSPLETSVQRQLETGLGANLAGVRVHNDTTADQLARQVDATAFTSGSHIFFRAGAYDPVSSEGRHLLAHEAAHTVQQAAGPVAGTPVPGGVAISSPGDPFEQAAVRAADRAVAQPAGHPGHAPGALVGAAAPGMATTPFLQRDAEGETSSTAAPAPNQSVAPPADDTALSSRIEFTDYGTFDVYPDNFIGPLPAADRTGASWPVREATFQWIQTTMASVKGATSGIMLEGNAAFKSVAMLDLAWLATESVGRELIEAMVGSGKNLTIKATTGGNTTSYNPDDDSWEHDDGTPGLGANITINYNTTEWNPYGGTEAWMRRPPAIGLAHEMVHAWTGMMGIRARGETDGVRRRELQATGLGEFSNAKLSENKFRAAFGLPLRPRY